MLLGMWEVQSRSFSILGKTTLTGHAVRVFASMLEDLDCRGEKVVIHLHSSFALQVLTCIG